MVKHLKSPVVRLNIKMSSYQYRDPHIRLKDVVLPV